jgi:hypothetical protein
MSRVVIALLASISLALLLPASAPAQQLLPPAQLQPPMLPSVIFHNESPVPLIIQGWSLVNGAQRRGAPIRLLPGDKNVDINVPPGPRFYSVYHANQPQRVLLRDFPIPIDGNLILIVRPARQNPNMAAEIVLPGTP